MLTRQQKEKIISELIEEIKGAKAVYFANFSNLSVLDLNKLRQDLKKVEAKMKVVKKTLTDLAFRRVNKKNQFENYPGNLGLIFTSADPLAVAKTLWNFISKNEVIKIVGGIVDDQNVNQADFISFAKLPTKEILLGRLVGSLNSPLRNFLWIWQSQLNKLVYALKAIQKTK